MSSLQAFLQTNVMGSSGLPVLVLYYGYICLYVSMTLSWHDGTMIIRTIKVHEFSSSQQRNMMGVTWPPSSQVDSLEYHVTRPKRALILEDKNYLFFFVSFFLLDPCI